MKKDSLKGLGLTLLAMAVVMGVIFSRSFTPELIMFSSDGPLGAISARSANMKEAWFGFWQDLNWLGIENPAALPHTTSFFYLAIGSNPVLFLKWGQPVALIGMGLSLWVLLRTFGFRHAVCGLAAMAAALNMNFFSHAAWGLPSRAWTLASVFLAVAALRSGLNGRPILKALVAGMAVSNGIMEGFDVGAIFSLYVGAFAAFVVLAQPGALTGAKIAKVIARTATVAVFAAVCAAAALTTLIGTQVMGVSGMGQDAAEKEKRWNEATMWSLPKAETLRVLVPGLFGYRMDADGGGEYWGAVGQSPGVAQSRHSGAGEYAGALVVIVAAFGIANAFRRKSPVYTDFERRTVLFFAWAALISLLFAWGRHAPFYKLVYALPYFSTIRNPIKFMHPFQMATLILFGFGLEALFRMYLKDAATTVGGIKAAFGGWWKSASIFERRWIYGSGAFVAAVLLGFFVYGSSKKNLLAHLEQAGFPAPRNEAIAEFSFGETGYTLVFSAIATGLVALAMSGWFSGRRVKLFVIVTGAFLALDLGRANYHWLVYYNYKERYASNPVFEFLKENAHEHRMTARVIPLSGDVRYWFLDNQTANIFGQVVHTWLQHQFQYYNIQSLEPVQMPRIPVMDRMFYEAMLPAGTNRPVSVLARMWELSNTRYMVGSRQRLMSIGSELGKPPLKIVLPFDFQPKPGKNAEQLSIDDIEWVRNENGRFAVAEYEGVLPRVKLFGSWRESTNDVEVLSVLGSPAFDPHQAVFVDGPVGLTAGGGTNFVGEAQITKYAPKHIEVSASNSSPAMLLYNDRFSPNWRVWVDGKEEKMLRANFIMRGVALAPGKHAVVMKYSAPSTGLKISIAAIALGLATLVFLGFASAGKVRDNSQEAEKK